MVAGRPADAPRTVEPFVVMAKPVGPLCNLDCSYCYYLQTERFYDPQHRFRMSDEHLDTYVRQYIEASPGPVVHFVWHGGEPTLAGLDFYRRAVELQQRYLPEGWTCWNNLQTNGTLLDDEWCAFLAEAHFDVGLSIDGTRWLHDASRKDRGGHGTYQRVLAAAGRLQAHGLHPDLLCTVTAATAEDPVGVYRGLRDVGGKWLQFIPIVRRGPDGRVTADSVSPEAYGRFLSRVFDEWTYRDVGRLNVQFFAETMRVWAGGTASLCVMAPTCGRVLVLEHDGAVYSCDHFVDPEHRTGSIDGSHLGALVDAPAQVRFGLDKRDRLPRQCRVCPWLDVCNGGCPKDRFALSADGEDGLNYLCDGFRAFFAHADGPARGITARVRAGVRADAIMADFRAEARHRWQGVGRNDPCVCGSGLKAKQCCWAYRP